MAVEFKEGYVKSIQQEGMSRVAAIRSQPLVSLYMNRADLKPDKKNKLIAAINALGGQELTLDDVLNEGPKKTALIDSIVGSDKAANVKALVGDLGKNVLAEVGVTAQGTANPLRAMIKAQVGSAEYDKKGLGTDTTRLRPLNIPREVYQGSKDVAASLMANPDTRLAGGRMILMMLGGYRPSDFKALRIENIDFKTGLVLGLELKTDDKSKAAGIGAAYFPRPQLDVIKAIMGDRKEGLLFENPDPLDKLINERLRTADMPEILYRQESTGKNITKPATAYDFRRMQETALQAAGYTSTNPVRKYLTWRPISGKEASEGYMALINQSAELEEANALSFEPFIHMTDGNIVEMPDGSVTKTHGQFLTEVGVTELSPYTLRYTASTRGRARLPIAEIERLDLEDTGVVYSDSPIASKATVTDPAAASAYIDIARTNQETRKVQAEINLREKQQSLANMPPKPSKSTTAPEPDMISSAEDLSPDTQKALGSGFDLDAFLGKTKDVVDSVVDKIPPKVIKAIPFLAAPAGYEIAKETASDMGLPGFLPEIIGAAGAAAEVVSPIAPTDIKDASIGFAGVIEKGEQERQVLLNRARQSKTTDIDRGPEAAPATEQDQGFLTR